MFVFVLFVLLCDHSGGGGGGQIFFLNQTKWRLFRSRWDFLKIYVFAGLPKSPKL